MKLVQSAINPITRRNYECGMRSFERFLASAACPFNPSHSYNDPFLWACYVTWIGECGNIADTARNYISGIQTLFSEAGVDLKPLRMPLVKRAIRGLRRDDTSKSAPKLPVTVSILTHVASVVDFSKHRDRTLWAMMTLATYGLLRCAELTQDPIEKRRFPLRRYWALAPDEILAHYFLPRSKADRNRDGTTIFVAANGSRTCPVAAVQNMLKNAPFSMRPTSPLFSFDGRRPITRYTFIKHTKFLLSLAGYDPDSYSGHSFRRGGAQTAFDSGLSTDEIQVIGRWKNVDVARKYFGFTFHKLHSLSVMMAKARPSRPLRFEKLGW